MVGSSLSPMLARPVIDLDATHTHIHSVEALSVKLSVYAALVGLLSVKTPEFGKQFVARTHQLFQQALESYNVVRARILFRFVVELAVARVISSSSVLDTASALLDAASEACEDLDAGTNDDHDDGHSNSATSSGQGVKRFQCRFWSSIVLYAVPWLAHHLGDARSSELRDLMYRIQTLLERSRSPLVGKGFLSALRPTPESTDTANTDTSTNNDNHDNHHHSNTDNGSNAKGQRLGREVLEHFFQCLSDEASAENAWALREVRPRPARHSLVPIAHSSERTHQAIYRPQSSGLEALENHTPSLTFEAIRVPTDATLLERLTPAQLFPASVLRLFPREVADADANHMTGLERALLELYMQEIHHAFFMAHKECTKLFLSLPFSHRVDHLLIESLFSWLMRLPTPEYSECYYCCLLLDACKVAPSIPPVVRVPRALPLVHSTRVSRLLVGDGELVVAVGTSDRCLVQPSGTTRCRMLRSIRLVVCGASQQF